MFAKSKLKVASVASYKVTTRYIFCFMYDNITHRNFYSYCCARRL